ncbi:MULTISPECIES: hypothetical protein [unclassified Bradyrhizobium]|uniref:hypothetical protein n=1 Tax=unclassified Bradyrhizobium TaxID=2631580 RepID=UPI001FF77308
MFDVYRNGRRDLLVLSTGSAIPGPYSANKWRKSRKRIVLGQCCRTSIAFVTQLAYCNTDCSQPHNCL